MSNLLPEDKGLLNGLIRFSLERKLIVFIVLGFFIFAGLSTSPFDFNIGIPRYAVPVDAIPDIGENQQIVFTEWNGRSPQDIEDQITYPMTVQLMGVPGVKTIRSYSYFGFSSIYVIFEEDVDFYWSRSRILEKLSSLPSGVLPTEVQPTLGPDATALGQVYWYTLEGLDSLGNPVGGWDLDELKSINDFYIKYALQGVKGVAEVASAGGMNREYQVDIDPDKLRHFNISLEKVYQAISESNKDVGARTIEINRAEYVIRAKGYVKNIEDLKATLIVERDNQPIMLDQIAHVHLGPAPRRGALDKMGVDVAGGVVVVRYGDNPLEVIKGIEAKVLEIAPGLPSRVLADGTVSKVSIVPFYNRAGLINETLNTLKSALSEEILITVIVILFMLGHLRSSLVISVLLPIAVLICFVLMKIFNVDANVVALSGIAIAIGTMVDMGIILCENIIVHLENAKEKDSKIKVIYLATKEVAGAILTAVSTTVISFIPVFTMTAAEGKLFKPLAYTKTFALVSALLLALIVIPPLALLLFNKGKKVLSKSKQRTNTWLLRGLLILATVYLSHHWMPLGPNAGELGNLLFVSGVLYGVLFFFNYFIKLYPMMLRWCLNNRTMFLVFPSILLVGGVISWSNTGKEFMPALDEGSFLLMPTTMPHASFEEAQEQLSTLDQLLMTIPEVELVVGKLGRAESSLDPAPPSMFEVIINYKSEYATDSVGVRTRQWRSHIKSPDDIWTEIVGMLKIPGMTSAPKLMPIAARIVMLQSGMRAPMGIKVKGPDLKTIEDFGLKLEQELKMSEGVEPATVIADRIVGKPYLEFNIDRKKAARLGLSIQNVQMTLMAALGGRTASYTVEGRERYPIRVRYLREERDNIEAMKNVLIATQSGAQIPVSQVAMIEFSRGPMVIKSEDGFLVGYVVFDKTSGQSESDVVEKAQKHLNDRIAKSQLTVPAGVSYKFTGNYENQLRSAKTLSIVLPLALLVVMLILYLQFGKFSTVLVIYTGVFIAWSGGFLLIGLYNTDWFLNFSLFSIDLREIFQIRTVNLSVAVWVGFIALSGIATDDGVVMSEYISQQLKARKSFDRKSLFDAIIKAGEKRIRPCIMTTSTTLLALTPILTSDGRGSDVMLPMSIPSFGGMLIVIVSVFIVPVLTSIVEEYKLKKTLK